MEVGADSGVFGRVWSIRWRKVGADSGGRIRNRG